MISETWQSRSPGNVCYLKRCVLGYRLSNALVDLAERVVRTQDRLLLHEMDIIGVAGAPVNGIGILFSACRLKQPPKSIGIT